VGEAVADISELALLDILLDGVEELLLGDLQRFQLALARLTTLRATSGPKGIGSCNSCATLAASSGEPLYLKLGIGPARNLDNHVQDALFLVGEKGNIVEGRNRDAIPLNVDAVVGGVGRANLAQVIRHAGDLVAVGR